MREASRNRVYQFENFRLDADNLLLFRDGEQLTLTPKVVATLLALLERQGEVVSKDDLMEAVWPDSIVEEGNLSQNLYLLRKTLGDSAGGTSFIETLRRRGYRFSGGVAVNRDYFKSVEEAHPVSVERKENVYSVVEWRRDAAKPAPTDRIERSPKRLYAGLLSVGVVVAALIALAIVVKLPSGGAAPSARNELTFLQLTDGRDVNDATISPDGSYIAYHEIDGDTYRMWVQQVGEANRIEVIPPTTDPIYSKTFAADGKSIFFSVADGPDRIISLYRVPALGGVRTKIAEDVCCTVDVSPDGGRIAFARHEKTVTRSAIIVADLDGSDERTLLTSNQSSLFWGGLAWSPDGKSIAYGEADRTNPNADPQMTIAAVDVETGATRKLSSEKWSGCGRIAWEADGKGIFFIGTKGGEGLSSRRDQLYHLSVETGEARRLTTDGNRHQVSSLGVTKDGAVLVVPFSRPSQLWIMDASGNAATARQITNGQADGRAGLAPLPDGRIGYLARAADSLNVWTVGPDGSDARQVTSQPEQVEELRATADGKHFYFSSRVGGKPRLFRIATDGSDLREAVSDRLFDIDSSISPDGNWIVYDASTDDEPKVRHFLRIVPAEGGETRQLTETFSVNPHFSPNGQFVSFVGLQNSLGIVLAADGSPIANFSTQPVAVLNIGARWTPDGNSLAYIARQKSTGNIWLQPINGSAPKQLTDFSSGEIYNFAFTSDGRKLWLARGYPSKNAILIRTQSP